MHGATKPRRRIPAKASDNRHNRQAEADDTDDEIMAGCLAAAVHATTRTQARHMGSVDRPIDFEIDGATGADPLIDPNTRHNKGGPRDRQVRFGEELQAAAGCSSTPHAPCVGRARPDRPLTRPPRTASRYDWPLPRSWTVFNCSMPGSSPCPDSDSDTPDPSTHDPHTPTGA